MHLDVGSAIALLFSKNGAGFQKDFPAHLYKENNGGFSKIRGGWHLVVSQKKFKGR